MDPSSPRTAAVHLPATLRRCLHRHPPLTPSAFWARRRELLAVVGAVFGFLAVAAFVDSGRLLLAWDEPVQRWVEASRTDALDGFFLYVSRFGSTVFVLATGAALTALTWGRCRAVALAVAASTLARPVLEFTLKEIVDRQRPAFERMVDGTGPSFPSGHVMASVALWGLLPLVVGVFTRSRLLWWASVAVAVVMIGLVSASRVYLGVHWPLDALAGLLLGSFFLLGVEAVLHLGHRRHGCGLERSAPAGAPPTG